MIALIEKHYLHFHCSYAVCPPFVCRLYETWILVNNQLLCVEFTNVRQRLLRRNSFQ